MIHRINLAGSLLAVSFLIPATMRGQAPQQPSPIPVARLAASPAFAASSEFSGSRLMLRTGLQTEQQVQDVPIQELPAPNLKSEDTALWLSLGSTLLPVAAGTVMIVAADDESTLGMAGAIIASSGLYFGPAVGYWYGGASGRGWKGVGIRLGTGIVAGLAITMICTGGNCDIFDDDSGAMAGASLVALAATGVILGSAIYDLAKVKSHVRRANEAKLRESGASLSVLPIVSPANGGTAGLVAQVRF
jgi:hypothetical protein